MTTQNIADPRPIPGAIDGLGWIVTEAPPIGSTEGSTNLDDRTMRVLHREDHAARWVAVHEMGHARWTPRKSNPGRIAKANAPATVLDVQLVEDCRILTLLRDAGLGAIPRDGAERIAARAQEWFEHIKGPEPKPEKLLAPYAMLCLQSMALGFGKNDARLDNTECGLEVKALRGQLCRLTIAEANAAGRSADRDLHVLSDVLDRAQSIAQATALMLRPKRRPPARQGRFPFRLVGPAAAYFRRRLNAVTELPPGHEGVSRPLRTGDQSLNWGTLDSMPPLPMTEHATATAAQRRKLAVPVGSRLGSIRRALTDGRCYRRTVQRAAKGGTILVDTSGSMNLEASDVHAVLAKLPAATVAIYSGRNDGGVISVIAKGGRCASSAAIEQRIRDVGMGNIVDGPALRWLAAQSEPRIWVCDGVVTGCGDDAAAHLDEEAMAIAVRGRIERCTDMHALMVHITEASR
jgi:hypothetical protein